MLYLGQEGPLDIVVLVKRYLLTCQEEVIDDHTCHEDVLDIAKVSRDTS